MNFNGNNPSPGDSTGSFKIPCCQVVDPITGQLVIVQATDPPQGEVFFVDCPPPVLQSLGTNVSAPSPLPFGPSLFAASPVPFGSNIFAPSPLPFGSSVPVPSPSPFGSNQPWQPYSYDSTPEQHEYRIPTQGSSYPFRGVSPFNEYENAGEYGNPNFPGNFNDTEGGFMRGTRRPLDGQWNSINTNFIHGIADLHEPARNEFQQNSLTIQPQESVSVPPSVQPLSDEGVANPSMAMEKPYSLDEASENVAATIPSGTPQSPSTATGNSTSDVTTEPSSSTDAKPSASTQSSSAHDSDKSAKAEDFCDEAGPRNLHTQQKISTKYCRGLLQAKTSGTKPWVTKILIGRSRATFYFDTLEEITVSADNINIGRLMASSHASYSMTLECDALRTKVLFIEQDVLRRFFAYTISLTVTGFLGVENLEWLMPVLKVSTLNIHQWRVSHVGRLGSLTHVGLPPQVQHLYFDARGTDNPTFVDSISRLYMDTYVKDHGKNSFLQSLTLVVVDFCALGQALVAQLQRLNLMLSYTEPSSAAVITTQMADDDILRELQALGFRYSHAGFIEELDGPMMKIHYWKKTAGQKSVILGFKARKYLSRTKEEIDVIKNL